MVNVYVTHVRRMIVVHLTDIVMRIQKFALKANVIRIKPVQMVGAAHLIMSVFHQTIKFLAHLVMTVDYIIRKQIVSLKMIHVWVPEYAVRTNVETMMIVIMDTSVSSSKICKLVV